MWSHSNKSTLLRFGALVALSNVAGAAPCDISTFGEIKAPSTAPAMVLIGVCSMAGPGERAYDRFDRRRDRRYQYARYLDRSSQTHPLAESDRHPGEPVLMPDSAVPGNVVAWVEGSGCAPVARAPRFSDAFGVRTVYRGRAFCRACRDSVPFRVIWQSVMRLTPWCLGSMFHALVCTLRRQPRQRPPCCSSPRQQLDHCSWGSLGNRARNR